MANPYFRFKQFTVYHDRCAMKVTTDACLFGAWVASLEAGGAGRALDIGAGTGLLSLMVAQQGAWTIDAVEIDPEAAAQASENCSASPWQERIRVYPSGIEEFSCGGYDLVFSNPPFYESDLRSGNTRKNLAHHSTELSLATLIETATKKLAEEGRFYLLMPARREAETVDLLKKQGMFVHRRLRVRQSEAHGPFRVLFQCRRQDERMRQEEMTIVRKGNTYSEAFTALLQPYYLYL